MNTQKEIYEALEDFTIQCLHEVVTLDEQIYSVIPNSDVLADRVLEEVAIRRKTDLKDDEDLDLITKPLIIEWIDTYHDNFDGGEE